MATIEEVSGAVQPGSRIAHVNHLDGRQIGAGGNVSIMEPIHEREGGIYRCQGQIDRGQVLILVVDTR